MTLYESILVVHVISGFTALFGGLIPMLSKKGSKLHVRSGRLYFWAMFGVLITTIGMFLIKPDRLLFLMLIGVFSFYNVFTGSRKVRFKKKTARATWLDWTVGALVLIAAMVMLGKGIHMMFLQNIGMAILYSVFGALCFLFAFLDLRDFQRLNNGLPMRESWLLMHITGMGGGYIATATAFFVVNIHFLPGLVVWLTPGIVGGVILHFVKNGYRKKAKVAKA